MSVRGLERIGDVLSSIGMTQQIIYMGWDEIRRQGWDEIRQPPPVKDNGRTHTTTNQKQRR